MSPVPAVVLLAGFAAAALLADRTISVAVIAAVLLAVCFRVPRRRRWPYLVGTLTAAAVLFVGSPLAARYGGVGYWGGAAGSLIGPRGVTGEEVGGGAF